MFKDGYFLQLSGGILGCSEKSSAESVQKYPKSAECETRWKLESGDTEQKVFKVKGCATGRTLFSSECLKVP